jgi:membrane protein
MNDGTNRQAKVQVDDLGDLADVNWRQTAKRVWRESGGDHLSLVASGIAFNVFLAFVPFLTAVVLIYGLAASPQEGASHIEFLTQALPPNVANVVAAELRTVVRTATTSKGFGLVITLAIALYGALRGGGGIIAGLNAIFEVDENRPFLRQVAVAAAITVGLIFIFVLASFGISVIGFLSAILPNIAGLVDQLLQIAFWVIAAGAVSLVMSLIYRYAPNRGRTRWRWLTAGSVLATVVWLAATWLFSVYVRSFGNFAAVYGALGAVIVFLFWLYISAYILLVGAELNQVLQRDGQPKRN